MNHTLVTVLAVLGGAPVAGYVLKRYVLFTRRSLQIADVLLGNPENGTPSLHVRLLAIEHELHPNSGLSLRDSVDRIEQALNDHLQTTNRGESK